MKPVSSPINSATPLRVVYLTAPGRFGGIETVVRELSSGLTRRGHAICVVCLLDELDDPASHPFVLGLGIDGVDVEIIQLPHRAYLRERDEVVGILRRFRGDVLHTHGYHADIIGGMAARAAGVPRITTVHGFTGGGWKNRVYEWLQRRSYRTAHGVIAVSEKLAADLKRDATVRPAVRLIRNAWFRRSGRADRSTARATLGLDEDSYVVGWIGRISREKGPDLALTALTDPAAGGLELCMVGEGPMRRELEARTCSQPGARIHWTGAIPNAGHFMAAFDVVLLSSRTEGTPMVLLEAMDAEVPAIVTRVGGIPDMVGTDEALLVKTEDPAGLLRAVLAVAADPDAAARRASNAALRLEASFAPEGWLAAHEAVYAAAVGRASEGGGR